MARDKARKTSNGKKKYQKEGGNSDQQTNVANGETSKPLQTVRQSNEKSSSSSSYHSGWLKKKCRKTEVQEASLIGAKENESVGAIVTGSNHSDSGKLELEKNVDRKTSRSSHKACNITTREARKKYILRSLSNGVRILRPRSSKSPKISSKTESQSVEVSAEKSKERRRKRKQKKNVAQDELSRTRKRVKYLLLQISFEQNLIDAYSNEGWKGQSQEKIRPEKELQRAASKIAQCKLRIREAFHHLDSLCLEGTLQQSAFDSEGQIYSEDIFCAKCGSKDLFPDNDIILCDGACDRGFHQKCLQPPLANEDIPPGDEGWLCPGCDCKVDCLDLVNDYLGTTFNLEDSWEKVFAEAAAIAVGDDKALESGDMPSDDSEDDDYDPDGPELGASKQQDEGLSSEESGSTGDADDSSNSSSDNEGSESDEGSEVSLAGGSEHFIGSFTDSDNKMSKMARGKKTLAGYELHTISDPDENSNAASPVSGKRHRQDVDYKKLHDEMFGKDASSEDEEWGPRKWLRKGRQVDSDQDDSSASRVKLVNKVSKKKAVAKALHVESLEEITLSNTTQCKKDNVSKESEESTMAKKAKHHEGKPQEDIALLEVESPTKKNMEQQEQLGSPLVTPKRNGSTRLPTLAVERLRTVFGENRLPSRAMKEDLAKELGISFKQVSKWFDNARNFSRHSAGKNQTEKADIKDPIVEDDNKVVEEIKQPASAEKRSRNSKSSLPADKEGRLGRARRGDNVLKSPNVTDAGKNTRHLLQLDLYAFVKK
eukprot:Gb_21021 [translate_table: standard]